MMALDPASACCFDLRDQYLAVLGRLLVHVEVGITSNKLENKFQSWLTTFLLHMIQDIQQSSKSQYCESLSFW